MQKNIQNDKEQTSSSLQEKFYNFFKRIFDIILSTVAIILLSPIFIVVSIIIVVDDGMPILFKQKRVGKDGKLFVMYKFRSMKNLIKQTGNSSYDFDWPEGVPDDFVFKSSGSNPNITKIGRFIRKYSIDELPQFINVFQGRMSLIGPRPEIPEITQYYNDEQRKRLSVKPGITGWAQVNGRSDIGHGDKIKYDNEYVKNKTIQLDIKIFFMTIFQTLTGKGSV